MLSVLPLPHPLIKHTSYLFVCHCFLPSLSCPRQAISGTLPIYFWDLDDVWLVFLICWDFLGLWFTWDLLLFGDLTFCALHTPPALPPFPPFLFLPNSITMPHISLMFPDRQISVYKDQEYVSSLFQMEAWTDSLALHTCWNIKLKGGTCCGRTGSVVMGLGCLGLFMPYAAPLLSPSSSSLCLLLETLPCGGTVHLLIHEALHLPSFALPPFP